MTDNQPNWILLGNTSMKPSQITDDLQFTGATDARGNPIPTYDDGYGPLWVHRDSMGVDAIIRAQTWEDAYSIWEDEFALDATETEEETIAEYGEEWWDNPCWQECYGFRGTPGDGKGLIYAKDIHGDALDLLDDPLAADLEISIAAAPYSLYCERGRYGARSAIVARSHTYSIWEDEFSLGPVPSITATDYHGDTAV